MTKIIIYFLNMTTFTSKFLLRHFPNQIRSLLLTHSRLLCKVTRSSNQTWCVYKEHRKHYSTELSESSRKLHERYLYVHTCVDFWADLPTGVLFDVSYLDTHSNTTYDLNKPVIVALHDSPGSASELIQMLQPFCNIGYRVIAPNFPGFGNTKGKSKFDDVTFTGKTDERTVFLDDFLNTVGVKRVDLLIGYGSGCNTATSYTAATMTKCVVKSLALLNPIGHRPSRKFKEYGETLEFEQLWNNRPLLRFPIKVILQCASFFKFKFLRQYPRRDYVKIMLHYGGFQYNVITSDTSSIGFSSVPRLITSNINNPIVDDEVIEEYVDIIGIPETHHCTYDSEGKLTSQTKDNPLLKFIKLEDQEYSLKKYSGQLTLILLDFLNNVLKKR